MPWGAPDVDVDDGQADQLVQLGEVGDLPPLVPDQPLQDVHCRESLSIYTLGSYWLTKPSSSRIGFEAKQQHGWV